MRFFISDLASKRLLLSMFLLFLAGMLFGIDKEDIKVTAPTFKSNSGINVTELNNAAADAFNDLQNTLYEKLNFLPDNFNKLAGGFANASVFSSDGASQRGYEGYNAFCFTFGFMGAIQLPQFYILKNIINTINNSEGEIGPDVLKDIVNTPFGLDAQISAQFGINTSKFLLKGLYLGFMFSKLDTNWIKAIPVSGFSFKTMSVGVNVNYQLIKQMRLLGSLLVWRGLNLGTGFIWQNTILNITPALSIDDVPIRIHGFDDISMPVNGDIRLGFGTNTYIIPVEAMTSIRIAWFLNLAFGAGVDVAFGSSRVVASGSFNVDEDKVNKDLQNNGLVMETAPSLVLSPQGGKSGPSIFNTKLMFAAGFNFGPIIIDIPVTYYLLSNGWSLGLTFGVTL